MKKYDPVLIRWRDSHMMDGENWVSEHEIDLDFDYIITTVGVFIEKNDRWVAVTVASDGNNTIKPLFIPRKTIVEMRVLK